jgi:hypothetical protein
MRLKGLLSLVVVGLSVSPAAAQVVINEILANPGSNFDGAEFIELRNKGGAAVSIAGWALTGTEFNGTCGGERHWAFPAGSSIPAGGYIVVAKDNIDAPGSENDGFRQRFGFDADFEMFDADRSFEFDDGAVPNLTPLNNEAGQDSQITLIPGNGYGAACAGTFNQYDAIYLYNGNPGGGATLIDVFEYRSTLCAADACTDGQTGANDAFVGLPGVGESLGRNATSGDTNNCSVDLKLGTPSPKAANVANAGPLLSNLAVTNPDPLVGEAVTFSITATDVDGIASVRLVYTVNAGAPDSVSMTNTFLNNYSGTLAPQADGAIVRYFVRASDSGNGSGVGVSKFPDYSTRAVRWGTQTILSTQFHSPPSDGGASNQVGNPVNLQGIVTAEAGLYNGGTFVIQSAPGFWNGVHCFDQEATTVVQRGDLVRVAGVVTEYFGQTEIQFFGPENVTVLSSSNPLPGPRITTASELATAAPIAETLEGVYVRVENVTVTNDNLGFGEWEITDGTGACRVDDDAFYNYDPTNGDVLQAVEGIVAYAFSDRKLEPRDDGDVIGPPIVSNVRYAPIPPLAAPSPLTISATVTDNGVINRAKLYYSTNNGATYDSLNLNPLGGGNYSVSLASVVGPEIDYHIEVTDNTGFNGRAPAAGDYDLYRGLVTIQTVQSTFSSANSDSSAFAGSPRNLAGIVTVEPGMIADNIFVIQNHWTTDPAFRAIQVFTGGSAVGLVSLGDSVAVSGDVTEFFNMTQLNLHFLEAITNYGFNEELPAFTLSSTQLPQAPNPPTFTSEPWEAVLVIMPNALVTDPNAGFGQYFIDNVDPRTGFDALIDDEARLSGELTYQPMLGDSISVRGYVDFSFSEYKIQPRWDADILPYDPADAVGVTPFGDSLQFSLHQNAPNPFSGPNTTISFALPQASATKLRVFDVQGRLVRTLVNGPTDAGRHAVEWNGRNDSDREVSSGVYFYRLQADGQSLTRKLTFLR